MGLLYESVIDELRQAKEIEERAYDRFLQARDVLSEALRTEGAPVNNVYGKYS